MVATVKRDRFAPEHVVHRLGSRTYADWIGVDRVRSARLAAAENPQRYQQQTSQNDRAGIGGDVPHSPHAFVALGAHQAPLLTVAWTVGQQVRQFAVRQVT